MKNFRNKNSNYITLINRLKRYTVIDIIEITLPLIIR